MNVNLRNDEKFGELLAEYAKAFSNISGNLEPEDLIKHIEGLYSPVGASTASNEDQWISRMQYDAEVDEWAIERDNLEAEIEELKANVGASTVLTDERIKEEMHAYFSYSGNRDNHFWAHVDDIVLFAQWVAAQAGQVAVPGWLPIESVPTDGQEVLLYLGKPYDRVVKARWFDLWENWIEGEFPDPQDEYCGIGSSLPTHWMPVPPSPAKESK